MGEGGRGGDVTWNIEPTIINISIIKVTNDKANMNLYFGIPFSKILCLFVSWGPTEVPKRSGRRKRHVRHGEQMGGM